MTTWDDAYDAVTAFAGTASPLAVAARRVNAIASAADAAREGIVEAMRAEGWTWKEVGEALDVTHQAAQRRFTARGIK